MPLVFRMMRIYRLGRLLGGGNRQRSRRRGRGGFIGPFPAYSTRTRRGSRVTVTGCCLPIPLVLAVSAGLGARVLIRR